MLRLADGIILFPGRATAEILDAARSVMALAPPEHYRVPGGQAMSVAMTGCGDVVWVADTRGYRYSETHPATGAVWPAIPAPLRALAEAAAHDAGFPDFQPDTALINLYEPTSRMGLHQDRDEAAMDQPIVSISLGRQGRFRFGGLQRRDPTKSLVLRDGDVLVFGGPARMMFHGIDRLTGPPHPVLGDCRINITFRRALGHV